MSQNQNNESSDETNKPSDYEPIFKTITVDGRRRGIRLESGFWKMFKEVTSAGEMSSGDIIRSIEDNENGSGNLTSGLRVFLLNQLKENFSELKSKTSIDDMRVMLNACPAAAFAIAVNKPYRIFNPQFIRYVRSNMPSGGSENMEGSLRLQIDIPVKDLLSQIRQSADRTKQLGFAIGLNNRSVRGRLRAVIAPCYEDDIIIGYVIE